MEGRGQSESGATRSDLDGRDIVPRRGDELKQAEAV